MVEKLFAFFGEGAGEVNTASNVGGGEGVFKQKTGVDLEFKSFLSTTTALTIAGNANDLTLAIANAIGGGAAGLMTGADKTKLDGVETGATADQSGAEIETAYNNQVPAASQAEVEAGSESAIRRLSPLRIAQAIAALETYSTASELLTALLTVDGAGSGLDADVLDGNEAAAFLLLTGDTMSGALNLADNNLQRPLILDYGITSTSPSISTGTLTLDLTNGNDFDVTWNADISTLTVSNWPASGRFGKITLRLAMDGTQRTISWPAGWNWSEGNPPADPNINEDLEIVAWTRDGGTNVQAAEAGRAFA